MCHPGWEGGLGENGYMYICTAESLHCSPETITTLLTSNDDTTLMTESEELKSVLMKAKEESEKLGLKLNI